jgi:APA family basic amino acid/polyamine antiporter
MTTVILVQLYGQSRISYSMSRDGLFPKFFGQVDEKHQTPFKGTWFFGIITSLGAGLINLNILSELVNIGTLTAFILVSAGILIMRYTQPDLHRGFKAPGVPFTPIISIIFCLTLVAGLNWETWVRFFVWLALGMALYFGYGRRHSHLNPNYKGAD